MIKFEGIAEKQVLYDQTQHYHVSTALVTPIDDEPFYRTTVSFKSANFGFLDGVITFHKVKIERNNTYEMAVKRHSEIVRQVSAEIEQSVAVS